MVVFNTTFEAAPSSPPRDLTVVPVEKNPTHVNLNWQPPKQANGIITGRRTNPLIFFCSCWKATKEGPEKIERCNQNSRLRDRLHDGLRPSRKGLDSSEHRWRQTDNRDQRAQSEHYLLFQNTSEKQQRVQSALDPGFFQNGGRTAADSRKRPLWKR